MAYRFGDITKSVWNWIKSGFDSNNSYNDYMKKVYDSNKSSGFGTTSLQNWFVDLIESSTGKKANEINQQLGEQNLGFEQEKFEYDKALQQEMFQREDTANQRTVNDMRLAGLNPLNMQGTNGAGNIVGTTAPQNNFQATSTTGLQIIDQIFNSALSAKATESNASLQKANANLLNAQANNMRIKNLYESDILANQLSGYRYDNQKKFLDNSDQFSNYMFNQLMGWTRDMPDWMKQNSAKFGYQPFRFRYGSKELEEAMSNPDQTYYPVSPFMPDFAGSGEISQQLLSDELLTGTMGVFGTLMKMLGK